MRNWGWKRRACWLAAALAIGAGGGWGGQKALTRMVPNHFLFEDAHIRNGRLYLLLGGFDLLERKPKSGTEIVEIDLASWKVVQTYRAAAASQGESASKLLVLGKAGTPVFLVTLRIPGDDPKLIVFTPER